MRNKKLRGVCLSARYWFSVESLRAGQKTSSAGKRFSRKVVTWTQRRRAKIAQTHYALMYNRVLPLAWLAPPHYGKWLWAITNPPARKLAAQCQRAYARRRRAFSGRRAHAGCGAATLGGAPMPGGGATAQPALAARPRRVLFGLPYERASVAPLPRLTPV